MITKKSMMLLMCAIFMALASWNVMAQESESEIQPATAEEVLSVTEIKQIQEQINQLQQKLDKALGQQVPPPDEPSIEREVEEIEEEIVNQLFDERSMQEFHKQMEQVQVEIEKAMQEMGRMFESIGNHTPAIPMVPKIDHPEPFGHFEGEKITEEEIEELQVNENTQLDIQNSFGSIFVKTQPGKETMTVKIHKHAGAKDKETAQKILDEIGVTINQEPDKVKINVGLNMNDNKQSNEIMSYCDIEVITPEIAALTTQNEFGSTMIHGFTGDIKPTNSFGGLVLENCHSNLNIENSHGNLHIKNHHGNIKLNSSFGMVILDNINGEQIKLKSNHGESRISGLLPNVQFKGDFEFGPVHLSVPQQFSGSMDVINEMGSMEIEKKLLDTASKPLLTSKKTYQETEEEEESSSSDKVSLKVSSKNKMGFTPPMFSEGRKLFTTTFGEGTGSIKVQSKFGPVFITVDQEHPDQQAPQN